MRRLYFHLDQYNLRLRVDGRGVGWWVGGKWWVDGCVCGLGYSRAQARAGLLFVQR